MLLSVLAAMGVVMALILYFAFKLDEEHFILRLFLIVMTFILLVNFGATTLEAPCEFVINETVVTGNTTAYTYMEECSVIQSNGANRFYLWTLFVFGLFMAYLIFFLGYQSLRYLSEWWRQKRT